MLKPLFLSFLDVVVKIFHTFDIYFIVCFVNCCCLCRQMWDDQLARYAEVWSGHCRYERPPQQSHPNIGSNLFYTRGYTSSWYSIRTSVQRSLHAWTRERDFFKYDMDCGMACSYVQVSPRHVIVTWYVFVS